MSQFESQICRWNKLSLLDGVDGESSDPNGVGQGLLGDFIVFETIPPEVVSKFQNQTSFRLNLAFFRSECLEKKSMLNYTEYI